ncbi:hypothetical protein GGH95_000048, partial [Coemansia sp. RSA 1836]
MLDSLPSTGNPMWKMLKYLQLCQSWRFHCESLIYQEVSISMNKALDAIDTSHYWLSTANDAMECNGQRHTKYAHLRIPYSAVLTGVLAKHLSFAPYSHAVFPQVQSIQVNVAKGGALDGLDDVECRQNVSAFVRRVKSMFPNAKLCSVSNTMFCLPEEQHAAKHYNQLLWELSQSAQRIKYYTSNEMFGIGTLASL